MPIKLTQDIIKLKEVILKTKCRTTRDRLKKIQDKKIKLREKFYRNIVFYKEELGTMTIRCNKTYTASFNCYEHLSAKELQYVLAYYDSDGYFKCRYYTGDSTLPSMTSFFNGMDAAHNNITECYRLFVQAWERLLQEVESDSKKGFYCYRPLPKKYKFVPPGITI